MTNTKVKTKSEQKEIGRIKITDDQDLVASLVDNEKLDLRIFVKTDTYEGPTKRGVRFFIEDGNWPAFKRLIQKIDKVYEEL